MRKLTLFFTTLFLSVGMAWAQTATLEVSTNVENPEFLYELRNANNVWMASNTAPTQNNIASFAFFGTDNANFYKIYSFDKKQWVSYDKSNGSADCRDFVKFADSQDAANAWKITEVTRDGNAVYQIQPQNNDGSVSNRYMNWNGGVATNGWAYTYDDTKTVGLWSDNASSDKGSAWILSEKVVSLSDAAEFVNGDIYTFETTRGWMGAKADNDYVVSTVYGGNNIPAADVKRTNPYFQWTVYKSDNDKYYLYNIGKGQFMGVESNNNTAVPFVATPAGLGLTFKKSSNTNYPIMFSTDNKAVVNHSGNHQYGLISWTDGWNTLNDGGSNHKVVKVGVLDETTLSTIVDLVANYEETAILKMPEAGKYYRIMAVEGWNDDARYLGSKNSTVNTSRAEYVANADAYTIFYFDGNYLKSYATGNYLVSNSNFLGYNGVQATGSKIGFKEDSNVAGVYNISFNDGGRWLYVHQNNYTDAGSSAENKNGYRFNIEEVTQLPVAQGGNTVYYTLTDAKANVKAGETLTLFVDTDETIELPIGVILDKNGHTADNVTVATPVAKVGEAEYASLAAAIKAASAGATITFVDNIKESVTLSKNVTIDGAGKTYTGTMSANNALTVTVQNVHFVNGGFAKNNSGTSGTYTIKDCTFDGEGKYAYPVLASNIGTLNVENCTVKDYQYGFLYVKKQSTKVSVKSVTVENCPNYAVYFASGVTTATFENLTVKNSGSGFVINNAANRSLTIKNCKMENVTTAINHFKGTSAITANVQGQNNFGAAVLSQYAKCVLAEDATLAATTAGLNVTTNVEGKEVVYQGGTYSVAVKRDPAGSVAYRADVTDKEDREGIAILLKDPYAKKSLVVKVYNGETLMFTCTRRDIDDEGKVMFPVTANTTANIVLSGKESGSWINEIHVAPTELNVPNRVEIWADEVLVQNYTHESGTILGSNLEKYLALACVKKFDAKIGNAGYETLAAAIEDAQAGEEIVLLRDITASDIITINKAITLDGNGKKLTSTATGSEARAINVSGAKGVTIKNLTIDAKGQRAINVIQNATNVTIDGVTATAANYTVNVAGSAANAVVAINNSTLNGLCTVNVSAAGAQVTVDNSTVNCNDNNTTTGEAYAALSLNKEAVGGSIVATNSTINVTDGSDSMKGRNGAENGTVTINGSAEGVAVMVAAITYAGSDNYHAFATLKAAVEFAQAGQTVTLLRNATGAGVVIDKDITIDFNEKTYTANAGVGSAGTQTLALQILKENNVTLMNGTLTSEGENIKMLINNYANLTVNNMKLVDATDAIQYVLSNNSGTVNIVNGSVISSDAVALDACKYASYAAPTVTVAKDAIVNGNVEVSATLNMNGTLNGNIVINGAEGVVNGAQGLNVTAMDDYKVAYADGAYTIVKKHYVAQVGEAKYETFAAAVAAAPAGSTITLIDDATEAATVVLTKNLTIDGDGKTFTGAIEFKKTNGSFTVKNVKFNGAGDRVYALKSQSSTTNLTVENCEATDYTYGFLYANSAIANVTVTDVTVKDVNYGVHSARGTNVTLNNFVAENVEYGVMLQNYSGRNVVLNNCSFTGSENPLYIWERNQTYKITFNFKGVNEMGKDDFCTSGYAVVNADAVVGTKVCGTLAEAVEAAEAGDAVTLLRNVELDALLTIDKSITLDLGEYNITRDARTALYVEGDDVEVTINGKGTVSGKQALYVGGGLVKVYGGNFHGLTEAVYVQHSGKAEIYGGKFSSDNVTYVLNEYDSTRETSDITVYGGTFVGFNPADNAAEGQGTNFVAAGLMAVDNGDGTFGIAKANIKMGDSYYATLAEAIAAIGSGDVVIELLADATLDYGAREAYGTAETTSVTINGNGNTLTLNQTNSDWSSFGLAAAAGKVAFNDMTIEKTGHGDTSGAWNTHAIIFSSPVEMTDVTINNGIAVQGGATLNNVKINEANGYYGLWVNGNGQAVTVNGGAINATNGGRGIKIADQYIDAPAQVTLTVNGTVFKTAKKAAVLVSSKAGAQIAAANVNIENVVEDQVNFVWVDEDWSQYFAEVEVTGATKAQEGLDNLVAQRSNGASYKTLAEAIAAAQAGETITLIGNTEEDVTVSKNLIIEGAGMQYTGTMTLNKVNVTVQNLNFVKGQISKSKNYNGGNVTIVNCNFDGQGMNSYAVNVARTGSVVIKDVTAQNYGYGFLQLSHANNELSIKDVKVMSTNYALKIDYSNGVTIDGLKVENVAIAAIYNSNYGTKTYTITNSDFSGATEAIKMWERNTTVYNTFVFAGGNTLGDATLSTSQYAIYKGVVAEVGTKKFLDLRAAFDAAQDGETVKMLDNVTLDTKTLATQNDGYATIINVAGKAVTLDLNGKNITVDAAAADLENAGKMLLGVFSADLGGHLTLTDNSDAKNGAVTVNVNDANIYSVFVSESSLSDKSNNGKITVNGGNYTTVGKVSNAMFFTDANEVITVNGGNFYCDGATTTASYPWMFNTYGNNERHVIVNGGTFNVDVNHQHRPFEVKIAETSAVNPNGDGTWTVVPAVAYITEMIGSTVNEPGDNARKVGYATLAAAVEAAEADEVVTLLAHVTGAGLVINKDVTIDFNEKTYTFNEGVGSNGTESNGFQILKGNNVTLQNGTLDVAAEAADKFYILVQNYANLTVEDMTLDGTNLDKWSATDGDSYVLSNNSGEVLITGNTDIIANNEGDKAFAFDACDKTAAGYELPKVYVQKTADDDVITITGKIERTGKAAIAISSGIFTTPIADDWCAEYYVPVQNADGTWTVDYRYIDEKTIVDDDYTPFENLVEKTVGELTYKRTIPTADVWQSIYVPFEIPVEELTKRGYDVAYYLDVHFEVVNGKINMEKAPEVHLILINEGTLKANFPYAIRAKSSENADLDLELVFENAKLYSTAAENMNSVESGSTVNRFVFAGTYTRSIPSVLTGNDTTPCYAVTKKGEFKKMGVTAGLPPFRVYMSIIAKDGSPFISSSAHAESIRMRVIGEESEDETTGIKFYEFDNEQASDYIYDLHGRRVLEPQKGGIYIVNGKKVIF